MAIMGEQAVCSSIQNLKSLLCIKVNLVNSMHMSCTIINLMILGEGKRNNVSEDFFWMESIISHHGSMSYLYNELAYGSLCNSIFYNSWFM